MAVEGVMSLSEGWIWQGSLKSLSTHHFVLARDPFSLRIRKKHSEHHPPPHVTASSDVTNPKTKMQEMTVS